MEGKKTMELIQLPGAKLSWDIPDSVPTSRVTNTLIEIMGDEFVISFFEQRGPIILRDEDPREVVKDIKSVKALCVARISLVPERMESFVKAFQNQLSVYMESKKKAAESPEK